MATFYTDDQIQDALRQLHIAPDNEGRVDGNEAARILTWRAREEYTIDYHYDAASIRQRTRKHQPLEDLKVDVNDRRNLYPVSAIFTLPISPNRGKARRGKKVKRLAS